MSDVNQLAKHRELAMQERERLARFPARVHRMTETERDERLQELTAELAMLDGEIQQASAQQNTAALRLVYGDGYGRPVRDDAQAEVDKAEVEMSKTIAGAEATIRGYSAKVNAAIRKYAEAANRAGMHVRTDMLINSTAQNLGRVAEHAARHGSLG